MPERLYSMKKTIMSMLLGLACGIVCGKLWVQKQKEKELKQKELLLGKHFRMFILMDRWVENMQRGQRCEKYFVDNHVTNVAIYGMSYIGKRLYEDIKDSNVKVVYGIDNAAEKIYTELPMYKVTEELPQADMIVVTPLLEFDSIKEQLEKKTSAKIVSVEDVVFR